MSSVIELTKIEMKGINQQTPNQRYRQAVDLTSKKEFFVKIYKKRQLVDNGLSYLVRNELNVLTHVNKFNNILEQLSWAQDERYFQVMFDACVGGDFFLFLREVKAVDAQLVRLWSVNLVRTLHALHKCNIIQRSLCPENLNITPSGYLQLMNFEFSKRLDSNSRDKMTYSVCGLPEYSPPELFLKQGVSFSLDYWQLGCLLYEMLSGVSPFACEDPLEMYEKIIQREPDQADVDAQAQPIVQKLLVKDKETRRTQFKEGLLDLLKEKWLIGLKDDQEKIQMAQMDTGWHPKVRKTEMNMQAEQEDSLLIADELEDDTDAHLFNLESYLKTLKDEVM